MAAPITWPVSRLSLLPGSERISVSSASLRLCELLTRPCRPDARRVAGGSGEHAVEPVEQGPAAGAAQEVVRRVDADHPDPRAELGSAARVVEAELAHVVAQEVEQHVAVDLIEVGAAQGRRVARGHL